MQIAFLGTGLMGAHQARRLLLAGHAVRVWNRTLDKARVLQADGAVVAESAAQAAAGADVVFVMLEDGAIVEQVLFDTGVAQAAAPGALFIDCSSIKPEQAQDHARRLAQLGKSHLDAPVSGGQSAAESGTLAIMAGGRAEDVARARPVLESMGRLTHVGPHGAGQLAKLANQMIVAGTIAVVAEALQLAARGGADPACVRQAIRGGFAESRVLELHGQRMVDGDFTPRARATMQLKDLRHALEAADCYGSSAPTTTTVAALFEALVARVGETDHSGLWLQLQHMDAGRATAASA